MCTKCSPGLLAIEELRYKGILSLSRPSGKREKHGPVDHYIQKIPHPNFASKPVNIIPHNIISLPLKHKQEPFPLSEITQPTQNYSINHLALACPGKPKVNDHSLPDQRLKVAVIKRTYNQHERNPQNKRT